MIETNKVKKNGFIRHDSTIHKTSIKISFSSIGQELKARETNK